MLALLGAGWSAPARAQEAEDAVNDCGVNALYLMLRLEGRAVDLADLRRGLPDHRADGLSMADLQRAAASRGCRLAGRRVGPDDVPLDRPAIAWLKHEGGGHFVVLRPVGETGTMVTVLDFPRPPRAVDYAELLATAGWSGRVMTPVGPWRLAAAWAAGGFGLAAAAAAMLRLARRGPVG